MKILAFDPGGTTGWSRFEAEESYGSPIWRSNLRKHIKFGQIGDNEEHHLLLWKLLMHENADVIICERFDNRDNEFAKLMSREYFGICKLWCELFNRTFVSQGADQAKGFSTDAKLECLGILAVPVHPWRHANDGTRHLVYWIILKSSRWPLLKGPFLDKLKALAE
jgi:hypothetical protein